MHGGVLKDELKNENVKALKKGLGRILPCWIPHRCLHHLFVPREVGPVFLSKGSRRKVFIAGSFLRFLQFLAIDVSYDHDFLLA